ncbi:hypothetical protein D9M69_695850 [compost metagenome]
MPVVVNDHVHLGDAGNFFVDLDAEEPLFCEGVPVVEVLLAVFVVVLAGLLAHMVQCVQQKTA